MVVGVVLQMWWWSGLIVDWILGFRGQVPPVLSELVLVAGRAVVFLVFTFVFDFGWWVGFGWVCSHKLCYCFNGFLCVWVSRLVYYLLESLVFRIWGTVTDFG